jgi:hypothetical protein
MHGCRSFPTRAQNHEEGDHEGRRGGAPAGRNAESMDGSAGDHSRSVQKARLELIQVSFSHLLLLSLSIALKKTE